MAQKEHTLSLKELRERRADLARTVDQRQNFITNLKDLDVTQENAYSQKQVERLHTKLEIAKKFGEDMQRELQVLCAGLEATLEQIGYTVTEAYDFQGMEKIWSFLGDYGSARFQNRAHRNRMLRLNTQNTDQSIRELNELVVETVQELGRIEDEYIVNIGTVDKKTGYSYSLYVAIEKLKTTQPLYKAAKDRKEDLDVEIRTLKLELEAGNVSDDERPAKEEELEDLEKAYNAALLEEAEYLEIVNAAQKAIPILKDNREAAQKTIQALRQMRRGLIEKQEHFEGILKNAMTSVRARAKLERYQSIDPAYNKAITLVTDLNIKVAGAAMQIAMERATKSPVDPQTHNRLTQELLGHINEYLTSLIALEDEVKKGTHVPDNPPDQNGNPNELPPRQDQPIDAR